MEERALLRTDRQFKLRIVYSSMMRYVQNCMISHDPVFLLLTDAQQVSEVFLDPLGPVDLFVLLPNFSMTMATAKQKQLITAIGCLIIKLSRIRVQVMQS